MPIIFRPSDWEKQSTPKQLEYLSNWIDKMEGKRFSISGRCQSNGTGCQFSFKEAHNAWMQPLLQTPAIQDTCSEKTIKACKELYRRARPDAFFSQQDLSVIEQMGLTAEGLKEIQRKVADSVNSYCPVSQTTCNRLLAE